ncbi:YhcH/YjgK/YiaL family protein [Acholeplasma equirhinis]|uniref:YhcH/YjgK/YiaL family protein n=1 Tax=Acholeplasma equirhinis TaxID=555393 RepID=UPI00197A886F|nr:YhcH/YjgK/YiaL family protein [Acholeplasma equirhinis]MBN3490731.1 YhcH/YjgK/YiaL family protein [Acholeplasma equirhinis]
MIVDHISNLKKYVSLNPNIKTVVEFMLKTDLKSLPNGKTVIEGDEVYVLRESYDPRPLDQCYFEGHKNYADIQLVLSGKEALGYHHKGDLKGIKITSPYDALKDVEKYEIEDFTKVILEDSMFALVNPEDLHMPKLKLQDSRFVEKVVFKIKVKGELLWQKL